jgi:transketolase
MSTDIVNKAADNIRILSAAMVEKAKSGHPGGAMGGADYINILFTEFLRFDPSEMSWPFRDRFFLDPGHMSPMLYSVLTLNGLFSTEDIKNFRQWGSPTPGHPERNVSRGIENTSGPLGQGHVNAIGAAIAERFIAARFGEWTAHKTYTYISDGGVQEEISQGGGRIAGYLGLSNLIMFYDSNDIQLSTETREVTREDTAMKYEAWGWKVMTIKGNDPDEIRLALTKANAEKEKPTLIIGKTIMGKGALDASGASFERKTSTHGMPLSEAGGSFEKTIENLGGNPADPFIIFDEVAAYYNQKKEEKVKLAQERKTAQTAWAVQNPELASKLADFLSMKSVQIDYAAIQHKENVATRAASSTVLAWLAKNVENMIVTSADLSNSDKTDGFLKQTRAFTRNDFSGAFLQAGVSELTMAAVSNGIALHGGIHVACATFFVFSDFMKPAVRLAALMELPVIYIWTHDAFRVGEDGPTHQPVEQEAQIRLMEQIKNHSGHRSMLVLRPADSNETTVAWQMALDNAHAPTALILSRQNIKDIPAKKGSTRLADAMDAVKGAYIAKDSAGLPDLIFVANGSEVSTMVEGAMLMESRHPKTRIRVVSAISEGLYKEQSFDYQQDTIPDNVPVLALTAGLPSTMQGMVGPFGKAYGMESFGYSAPYKVLDEKLGFTPEHVYQLAVNYMQD